MAVLLKENGACSQQRGHARAAFPFSQGGGDQMPSRRRDTTLRHTGYLEEERQVRDRGHCPADATTQ